eukprot:TRINITY_DN72459_c0_g1_i1.p1 TRINITY_DN72459_c0_g1~~TRINITY_DN72459_c0_g1_i1.p1  ORF type:complete len:378 (+),score=44.36 TRINITY_DN72459_c0_g1_i1:72-1136(+)
MMKSESIKGKVLVTGVNGFLGSYVAKLLLEKGHFVRGSVRDTSNAAKVAVLKELPFPERLEVVQANLLNPSELENAVKGCDYVMHVAAPVTLEGDESTVVNPAVEGTKAIMEASIKHGVKAVVMTSSLAAVIKFEGSEETLTEDSWPNLENSPPMYVKAKTLSEKAAWDIYNNMSKGTRPRLVVINPGLILGPTLIKTPFHSGDYVKNMLNGTMKMIPQLYYAIVDVRDVALAHIKAMDTPEADGKRYICFSGQYLWIEELAKILKDEFGKYGYDIPTEVQKECPVKDKSHFLYLRWNKKFKLSNERIRKDLGIEFKGAKKAVIDMANSMIKQGSVPDLTKKQLQIKQLLFIID